MFHVKLPIDNITIKKKWNICKADFHSKGTEEKILVTTKLKSGPVFEQLLK